MLTYLLPSLVDTSGAGIKRTRVINKNRFQNKINQTTINLNSVKIFVTFCSGFLWSWNKTHSCYQ